MSPDLGDETAIEAERTRLMIYRRADAAAIGRGAALTALHADLVKLAGAAPEDDHLATLTLPEGIGLASTALMMSQSTYRAAMRTLADPVQRSLRVFLS